MPNIKMPDGQIVSFPEDMPREQINSMIFSRYPQLQPEIPNAVRWASERMQKEGRTEPSLWESFVVGLSGAGQGAGGALNRGASSLTLSGSDYAQRKMGINPYETVEKIIDSTKSPTVAALTGIASGGAEVAGGLPLGAGVTRLAAGLPKYGKLAAGVGTSAAMGGISSAFNSDFDPEATVDGAIKGAAIDLAFRGAGKGLSKVYSAKEKIKGVPRTLAGAAGDDKGAAILDRAVKESKKSAKLVYGQAPEAKEIINQEAIDTLDDAVRGGVDVKGNMASAKKAYGDFIDTNKANQVVGNKNMPSKVSDLGIKGLTDNQKVWLNQAWSAGKRNTLEKAGSLGHLDEMSKELNKMVQASRLPNATGVGTVATPETVALQGLKDKVDDVIEKAGLQSIKAQYRQAKTLEDSFNRGLKFKPTEIKTRDLTFKTPEEKSAFAQGLIEQIKMNPETKNIAGKASDLRGALRKTIGEDSNKIFEKIDNLDRTYQNVSNLRNLAGRKLVKTDPIGKLTAGPIRELGDSVWSPVFALADVGRRYATGNVAERAAKYLLNPNLKAGPSWNDSIQPAIPSLSLYLLNKRNRKKGEQ